MLKWLTNMVDPKERVTIDAAKKLWLKGKVLGDPKATYKYTVEELKRMDMVGVYEDEEAL